MIVRIVTEGRFRMGSAHLDELNDLDNEAVRALAGDNESEFRRVLAQMLTLVRRQGAPVDPSELVESDVLLPPDDITLEEARHLFVGEGLIPG